VEAQERFSAGASAVSLFLVVQLAVYAALQVPVGVALDRFGSRVLLLAGALTMATGQLVLALATDVPTAIAARVLVGAGDAMSFISVLRVVSLWFPGRTVPLVTQLTGIVGQLGSVAATYPCSRCSTGRRGGRRSWEPPRSGCSSASSCSWHCATPHRAPCANRRRDWRRCAATWRAPGASPVRGSASTRI